MMAQADIYKAPAPQQPEKREAQAVSRWARLDLARRFGDVLEEPLPREWLQLMRRLDK